MKRDKLIVFFVLCGIALHIYLILKYYPLKFALSSGDALCNLNAIFNCDAVSASRFATFLGVPAAVWGAVTNFVLLCFVLIRSLRLTDNPEQATRYNFYLASFIAFISIVMGSISVIVVNSYCIFCIMTYFVSFAALGLIWSQCKGRILPNLREDIFAAFGPRKTYLLLVVVGIPALSFVIHSAIMTQYDGKTLKNVVNNSIAQWQANPERDFTVPPMLSIGPSQENAKMIIAEYADFLCSHCKNASPTLQAFKLSSQDVRLEFYAFPLDGTCNPEMKGGGDGRSCFLTQVTYCAEKQGQGWPLHDLIFKNQKEYFKLGSVQQFSNTTKKISEKLNLDWLKIESCLKSPETQEYIAQSSRQGDRAGVRGTPSVFANRKHLPRGQLLPVLQKAYSKLK